jgi:hypothetical protein
VGTDWPHATEDHKPDDAKMLDWLASLLPSSELEASTFVQNASPPVSSTYGLLLPRGAM